MVFSISPGVTYAVFAVVRLVRVGDQQHRIRDDLFRCDERRGRIGGWISNETDWPETSDDIRLLSSHWDPGFPVALETNTRAEFDVLPDVRFMGPLRCHVAGAS